MRQIIRATPSHHACELMPALPAQRSGSRTGRITPERRAKGVIAAAVFAGSLYAAGAHASCDALASRLNTPQVKAAALAWQKSQPSLLGAAGQISTFNGGDGDDDGSLVGLWHTYFLSGGQVFDEGFDQFTSDGLEILNDTAPPQPANGSGTICLGVFKKTGHGTFKLRHPFWSFDAKGVLVGTGLILEHIVLDKDADSYSGSFSFLTYDLTGALTFETTGELRAQRIVP
ncbi:MAG: hypothetical protein JO299_15715 [Gammaproteobacteria bacterium]|nr:hypothetical protein [Gammaproteobacteria bacterium]